MDGSANTNTKKLRPLRERGKMVGGSQRSCGDTRAVKPRTLSLSGTKSSIQDQMVAFQNKIQLIEYDHKAYQESTSYTIKENEEIIRMLHQENKKMKQELIQEKQIQADREAKAKDGKDALQLNEGKLRDNIKHLNALYHQMQVRRKCLEEKELLLKQNAAVKQYNRSIQEKQVQHLLENKLGEAKIKLQDVKHMSSVYRKITTLLEEEMTIFQPQIEQLQTEILLFKNELKDLKMMNHNVEISRDTASAEYQHLRKEYRSKRNQKEQILRNLNHQANELRQIKKECAKSGQLIKELTPTDYEESIGEEREERVRAYEEATEKIKEATGAVKECEVLQRFLDQVEKLKYLEKEKVKAETTLREVKDRQEKTYNLLKELKYSKQAKLHAKLSDNQKMLEELQARLHLESKNQDDIKNELEIIHEVLNKATSEVKRLEIKLQLFNVSWTNYPLKDRSLNPPVLDVLAIMGQKLQNLQKQLEGLDAEEIFREMKEEEFVDIMERNLPASNLRISLMSPSKLDESDDEAIGEDYYLTTRENIKNVSEQFAISKRKANIWCEKWGLGNITYA